MDRGSVVTPRTVERNRAPLFNACSVQRRRSTAARSAAGMRLQRLDEAIEHRTEAGPRRVAYGPELALCAIHGAHGHVFDAAAQPSELHQHLGLDVVSSCAEFHPADDVGPEQA